MLLWTWKRNDPPNHCSGKIVLDPIVRHDACELIDEWVEGASFQRAFIERRTSRRGGGIGLGGTENKTKDPVHSNGETGERHY